MRGETGGSTAQRRSPGNAGGAVPLPLPNNLVMMSLIEAAQAERSAKRRVDHNDGKKNNVGEAGKSLESVVSPGGTSSRTETMGHSEDDEDMLSMTLSAVSSEDGIVGEVGKYSTPSSDDAYESGDDDSAVWIGASSLAAPYGTYAVRERAGLMVLPWQPNGADEKKGTARGGLNGAGAIISSKDWERAIEKIENISDCKLEYCNENGGGGDEGDSQTRDDFHQIGHDGEQHSEKHVSKKQLEGPKRDFECGQNRVRQQGLECDHGENHPGMPRSLSQLRNGDFSEIRDVERIWTHKDRPKKQDKSKEEGKQSCREKTCTNEPFPIEYGQTLQIVAFSDGVATLARCRGFLVASSTQLVKGEFRAGPFRRIV